MYENLQWNFKYTKNLARNFWKYLKSNRIREYRYFDMIVYNIDIFSDIYLMRYYKTKTKCQNG